VPRASNHWHPLSAAYHVRCKRIFFDALRRGQLSVVEALERLRVDAIGLDELAAAGVSEREFLNVNTPEDRRPVRRAFAREAMT